MNLGKITSLANGPKRDVELRISASEIFSAISDTPGAIKASEVVGIEVVEKRRWWRAPLYRLYVLVDAGRRVLFYTSNKRFDIALLLDEFEASLRNVPRSWEKA